MREEMRQAKLFPIVGVVDLGPVGEGVSGARWLGVYHEQGLIIYAAKCRRDEHPYLLLNEAVCAALAGALHLPIPALRLIRLDNQLWFGLEKKEPKVACTPENLAACVNSDQVPGVLIFDVFVCNPDRHEGNVLLHQFQQQPLAIKLWIIDHSHALVSTKQNVAALVTANHNTQVYLKLPHHGAVVKQRSQFESFLERLEALDSTAFQEITASLPAEFIPKGADLVSLTDFLIRRRDEVRTLIQTAFQHLPE